MTFLSVVTFHILPGTGWSTEAVLDIDAENARASYWHTDVTFVPAFPLFSVLRGVVIPPVGGDTVWANTVATRLKRPSLSTITARLTRRGWVWCAGPK